MTCRESIQRTHEKFIDSLWKQSTGSEVHCLAGDATGIIVMAIWGAHDPLARNPGSLHFWGMISLATIIGGFLAYPINRWLVDKGLKHGMMTVRKGEEMEMRQVEVKASKGEVHKALIISLVCLGIGSVIGVIGAYL